ncbi:MAG: extracellular solute-binding protein [Deinococcus sp.]|nr:extracellular solute-binding protein [Deinococcus sp.]
MNRRRVWLWALAGLALFMAASAQQQGVVDVLCVVNNDWCVAIEEPFEQATGIDYEFIRLSSNEALNRLRSEKAAPTFDAVFGGTNVPHEVAFDEGLYEPLSLDEFPVLSELQPSLLDFARGPFTPDERLVRFGPIYTGILGIGVNEACLAERAPGVPVPTSWQDLTNPALAGLIAMPNPNTSGTAGVFLFTMLADFGRPFAPGTTGVSPGEIAAGQFVSEAAVFAPNGVMAGIRRNVSQFTASGFAPGALANAGEVCIVIQFLHDVLANNIIANNTNLTLIGPSEGVGFEIGVASLVANGPNPVAARAFVDWALQAQNQVIAYTVANSYQIPSNANAQPDPRSPRFEDLPVIGDFGPLFNFFRANNDRLIERFTREVFPLRPN